MHRPSKRNQRASWHIPLDEEDLPAEEAGGDNRTDGAHKQWGSGVNRLDGVLRGSDKFNIQRF